MKPGWLTRLPLWVALFGTVSALLSALPLRQALAQFAQAPGSTITAVVQNSFNLTETTVPDIGVNVFLGDIIGADIATFTLNPDGSTSITNSAGSQIIVVDNSSVSAGVLDISNAGVNADVAITFFNVVDLTCAACAPANPDIQLLNFTHDAGPSPQTDAAGNLTINFGFSLETVADPNQYQSGTYVGSFDVMVSYQ